MCTTIRWWCVTISILRRDSLAPFFFFCAFGKKLGREFFETARRKHSGIDRIENNREGHMGRRDGHGERKNSRSPPPKVSHTKSSGLYAHVVLTSCHELIYYKQTRNCNTLSVFCICSKYIYVATLSTFYF